MDNLVNEPNIVAYPETYENPYRSMYGGIDCGKSGACAVVDMNGANPRWAGFDREDGAVECIKRMLNWPVERLAVEHVHAMPGQGVVSMFTFGVEVGKVHGTLTAMDRPFLIVTPQVWQRILPDGIDAKKRVRKFCEDTWGLDRFIPAGCRVPHQGGMDAAVIAEWCRRVTHGLEEFPKDKIKRQKKLKPFKL